MDAPKHGPLSDRHGPFIRNAQPIGNDMFLVEAQKGTKGRGKVWSPTILRPNPETGKVEYAGTRHEWVQPDHLEAGYVKPATSHYRKGQWKCLLWYYHNSQHFSVEAYLPTQVEAVQFMIRTAPEFLKP